MSVALQSGGAFAEGFARAAMQVLPSGLEIELHEVLLDEVGGAPWVRFRFVAPELAARAKEISFEAMQADFEHLCAAFALDYLRAFDLTAEVVAISLADRAVPFGAADPDATQMIEVFRVDESACAWGGLW